MRTKAARKHRKLKSDVGRFKVLCAGGRLEAADTP
jgi:hypothetical protein